MEASSNDFERVAAIVNGYQRTCLAVAAIELRIFEALAADKSTVDGLAVDLAVDREALCRLLRALDAIGLVSLREGCVSLTSSARLLVKGGFSPGLRAWTVLIGGEYLALWGRLADGVRTGAPVFESVFNCSAWQHREGLPALNEAFNELTSAEQLRTIAALLKAYDFSGCRCVADIGGGHGNLVAGVLTKYRALEGVVFDLPHVVQGAESVLVKAGVADRCRIVGGSFLDTAPDGADVHILKHVLHNWDDASCRRILRNVRAALMDDGALLIIENVIPAVDSSTAVPLAMLDIHMLLVHGGRERTHAEYEKLLASAGFQASRLLETRPGLPDIIEAVPA